MYNLAKEKEYSFSKYKRINIKKYKINYWYTNNLIKAYFLILNTLLHSKKAVTNLKQCISYENPGFIRFLNVYKINRISFGTA